ncbi:MAG: hypothetical protein HRU41_20160 [Saprospiraceae bacterium]|nr:hypothetical protein [Saprospiraceae bacterium]
MIIFIDGWDLDKAKTTSVVQNSLNWVEGGITVIFPDSQSQRIRKLYFEDPKSLEKAFASQV